MQTHCKTHRLPHLGMLTGRQKHDFLRLTVKLLVFGGEDGSQGAAAVLHQAFEIDFTAMCDRVLHLRTATRVPLRTHAQVLTCGEHTHRHTFYYSLSFCPELSAAGRNTNWI